MPATAWLGEMRAQLSGAKEDAQIRVTHADGEIRRHRNRVYFTVREDVRPRQSVIDFRWCGEPALHFPAFGGTLHFDVADEGVDAAWLREQELQLRQRCGGEKVKTAPDRPGRSLKHHYQALGIPAWERPHLPIVAAGSRLIYAAGIGMNFRDFPHARGNAIRLRWEKTPA
jgi:tRNA(Ile)-lysidine synthase